MHSKETEDNAIRLMRVRYVVKDSVQDHGHVYQQCPWYLVSVVSDWS
jgi:hypothetical protein